MGQGSRAVGNASPVHDVRRATTDDADALAATLARAFHDDPVTLHLFPDVGRRRRVLPRYFSVLLRSAFLRTGEVWTTSTGCAGAAMWSLPSQRRPGWRETHYVSRRWRR